MLRDIRGGEFSPCAKITAEKIVSCQRRKAQLAIDRHSRRGVEIKEHQFPVSLEDVVETASSLHAHIDGKGLLRMTEEEEKGGGKGGHDRGMLFHRDHHLVLRLACLVLHAGLWVVPDQDMTRVQWDEERASLVVEGGPLRASPYRSRIPFDFQRVIDTLRRNSIGECSFLLTADKANPMSDLATHAAKGIPGPHRGSDRTKIGECILVRGGRRRSRAQSVPSWGCHTPVAIRDGKSTVALHPLRRGK